MLQRDSRGKRTVEWTVENFVTNEIRENAKTHEPSVSVCQRKQTNKTNKRAGSKKNVKNTRSSQNNKTNKRSGSKKNVKNTTSKQNKTKSSSSKNKKNNVDKKNSGKDSTKKKGKKKDEEESSSSDSDESSVESIAYPGEICRNCSRGNIDQLFQDAEAEDFGFPEYVPRRPSIEDPSFNDLI
ncbi:hypothetical protein AVEN_128953-1 [Araneus ventricosus]|uniref:Uncharacterized protein n=1 Tax=Araneus ventricosus TaxID=182803 RepID=A0A4Y2QDP4_ARAVE|nr:hypothetical protein AVEN_128953-1 [Araneus ventricosus]